MFGFASYCSLVWSRRSFAVDCCLWRRGAVAGDLELSLSAISVPAGVGVGVDLSGDHFEKKEWRKIPFLSGGLCCYSKLGDQDFYLRGLNCT